MNWEIYGQVELKVRKSFMTMQELLEMLREKAKDIDVSQADFMAIQFNIKDRDPGIFYVEIKDHNISIEPYEYNDRQCAITMKMDNFVKLINGKLDAVAAFTLGKLKVDGDIGKALEFSKLIKK